jgi:hypothetical protein
MNKPTEWQAEPMIPKNTKRIPSQVGFKTEWNILLPKAPAALPSYTSRACYVWVTAMHKGCYIDNLQPIIFI